MNRFRVVYSRGSFGFVSLCDTHEAALAQARALYGISGVWHVHVEDAEGMKIACDYELCAGRESGLFPAAAFSPPL